MAGRICYALGMEVKLSSHQPTSPDYNSRQGKETKVEELIKAMSDEDLEALKAKYATNESIVKLINGILERRQVEADKAKVKLDFEAKVLKLAKLPTPPEDVHNLYLRWAEVDEPRGEPIEVTVNGVPEQRTPTTKVWKWVIEVNKGFQVARASTTKANKRSISVSKRTGNLLEPVGNFSNATKACGYLKLIVGSDSANRVLQREGYVIDTYIGDDTIV